MISLAPGFKRFEFLLGNGNTSFRRVLRRGRSTALSPLSTISCKTWKIAFPYIIPRLYGYTHSIRQLPKKKPRAMFALGFFFQCNLTKNIHIRIICACEKLASQDLKVEFNRFYKLLIYTIHYNLF